MNKIITIKKDIMEFKTPISLKKEHEELHTMLRKATQLSGKTGEAAKKVAELMHPHFVKEEEYALPPLGLLPQLSSGKYHPEVAEFAEKLMLHAQTEEEVSYPTAILIGEFIRLKFN